MKTIRHTVNVPAQMEQVLKERIQDYRSLSGYFVSLGFTDMLYLPKRPDCKNLRECQLATATIVELAISLCKWFIECAPKDASECLLSGIRYACFWD